VAELVFKLVSLLIGVDGLAPIPLSFELKLSRFRVDILVGVVVIFVRFTGLRSPVDELEV